MLIVQAGRLLALLVLFAAAGCQTPAGGAATAPTGTAVRLSDRTGVALNHYLDTVGPAGGFFYVSRDGAHAESEICPGTCPNLPAMQDRVRRFCKQGYGNKDCVLVADGDRILATLGNWQRTPGPDAAGPGPSVRLSDRSAEQLREYLSRVRGIRGYFFTSRDGYGARYRVCGRSCASPGALREQTRGDCRRANEGYDPCVLIAEDDRIVATLGNWHPDVPVPQPRAAAGTADDPVVMSDRVARVFDNYLRLVSIGGGFFYVSPDGTAYGSRYCPVMRCSDQIGMRHKAETECRGRNDGKECLLLAKGGTLLLEVDDSAGRR